MKIGHSFHNSKNIEIASRERQIGQFLGTKSDSQTTQHSGISNSKCNFDHGKHRLHLPIFNVFDYSEDDLVILCANIFVEVNFKDSVYCIDFLIDIIADQFI